MSAWHASALCAQVDLDVMFPGFHDWQAISLAKQTCRRCPYKAPCLAEAIREHDVEFGIRGGLGPAQRRRLARHHAQEEPA